MLATLRSKSIWAKGAIPLIEYKYRNLKRIVLPVIDLIFAGGGIMGAIHGIPALDQIFSREVSEIGGYTFAFVALVCFVGVSFPRLWLLEIFGKSALLGMIGGYIAALIFGAFVTKTSAAYVLSLAIPSGIFIYWRLTLLSEEARDRGPR